MRWNRWPGPAAAAAAGTLYAAALAPGLTWAHGGADGGDLLAAALTGGVPHPPGYPTYQILLRAAIALYPGEPARAGNWLSALCMAVAAGLLADLARRMLTCGHPADCRMLRHELSATAGALAWAAAPAVWGQATITEVYGLHALACLAVLWLLWRWREDLDRGGSGARWLALAGLAFGLGLGNHLSLALLVPGALAWLWAGRGQIRGLQVAGAWALAGLGVYGYLPLAAAGYPPVNWGDPHTPARLAWVASGWLYRDLVFGLPLAELPGRLAALAGELLRQFGTWGALLAVAGLWQVDRRQHAWWRATGLIALAYAAYAVGYRADDAFVYLLPAWAMVALWLAAGVAWTGEVLARWRRWPAAVVVVAMVALIALPGISVARFWPENDLRRDTAARDFVAAALAEAEPGAVILTATDGPTFALWYAVYGLGQRPDVTPLNVSLFGFDWYRLTLHAHHLDALMGVDVCGVEPDLAQLVTLGAGQRPFYRVEPLPLAFPGMREQPAGTLVRILPE